MISLDTFHELTPIMLGGYPADPDQVPAIDAAASDSVFIVAGPGSGKTTTLTLRILKLIFVDDIEPQAIFATTFTIRAAKELRSRFLECGDVLMKELGKRGKHLGSKFSELDLNQIETGTLDSLANKIMMDYRTAGTDPLSLVQGFVANGLMTRKGLFGGGRYRDEDLKEYLLELRGSTFPAMDLAGKRKMLRDVYDRIIHDRVDFDEYRNSSMHDGLEKLCDAIVDYRQFLDENLLLDFPALEEEFLNRIKSGTLKKFTEKIKLVLVDEYQDTNFMQESIYFELAKVAVKNGGGLTVVGDDDQSLYRFRGATVDLFVNFKERVAKEIGIKKVKEIFLQNNYRSTIPIVNFVNDFVELDRAYDSARVDSKPKLKLPKVVEADRPTYPVIGLFRDNLEDLAFDLSDFIDQVVNKGGYTLRNNGETWKIKVDDKGGSPADLVFLSGSPSEIRGKPRLPYYLRNELEALDQPIEIFNPRGRELFEVTEVCQLCGLILQCIDPKSEVQDSIGSLYRDVGKVLDHWRESANELIKQNPEPNYKGRTLKDYVRNWQKRKAIGKKKWPRNFSVAELAHKLITWIKPMQIDIEKVTYFEAILRTITETSRFASYSSQIVFSPKEHEPKSIKDCIWQSLVPIANGSIEIDEELLQTLPPNRLSAISIHQAKGLEFPLVIVDIGSDYNSNHRGHALRRFPPEAASNYRGAFGSDTYNLEDSLREFSDLDLPTRSVIDRACDDTIRRFFVAYSRAQEVLLLVGSTKLLPLNEGIPKVHHLAMGWDRQENWNPVLESQITFI